MLACSIASLQYITSLLIDFSISDVCNSGLSVFLLNYFYYY